MESKRQFRNHLNTLRKCMTPDVRSWRQLHSKLCKLPGDKNLQEAGKVFEWFVKYYLIHDGGYKQVLHDSEISTKLKSNLKLPTPEKGVDLLLEKRVRGKPFYVGVQVKLGQDQSQNLSWSKDKLANLIAHRTLDQHFVFSNVSSVDGDVKRHGKDVQTYLISHLLSLDEEGFTRIRGLVHGKKATLTEKYSPRKDQKQAIKKVVAGFDNHKRGKIIVPCGAGKTLTSLWIKERLRPRRTLVLVPSLALLRQFKREWLHQQKKSFDFICVCSENDIDTDKSDTVVGSVHELGNTGLGVTTKAHEIRSHLKEGKNLVVFSTYQSSPKVAAAMKGTRLAFDLAICDEAHRTATKNKKESHWVTIHNDKKIKCKKRLYMTATPRVASPRLMEIAKEKEGRTLEYYLHDMNNVSTFGPEFFKQSFAEAIKDKILVPYQIVIVGLTNENVRKELRAYTNRPGVTYEDIVHNYAVKKAMKEHGASRVLTFHSRVEAAKQFSERHTLLSPVKAGFVSGKMSTAMRETILEDNLKFSKKGIVSNARCLTEGVDVPSIDAVFFCDPKKSNIDILQASGRALRLSKKGSKVKKKMGFIFIPVFHSSKKTVEEEIKEGVWRDLFHVIVALKDHDARLDEVISRIVWGKTTRKRSPQTGVDISEEGMIVIKGFEKSIEKDIFFQVLRKTLDFQYLPFEEAREFSRGLRLGSFSEWRNYSANKFKDLKKRPDDIPSNPNRTYKKDGWISWSDWLGHGYISTDKRPHWSFERARRYARRLGLNSGSEWVSYSKGKLKGFSPRPKGLPGDPRKAYGKEFLSMADWLGSLHLETRRPFRSYRCAKRFAQSLELNSKEDWKRYCKRSTLPSDIPKNPDNTYKVEFEGWGKFLGNFGRRKTGFLPFEEARDIVRSLKLGSREEWHKWWNKNFPDRIPKHPEQTYFGNGWRSLPDWIGTPEKFREYRKFSVARAFARALKLSSSVEWRKRYLKGLLPHLPKLPYDIPTNPSRTYSKDWIDWYDWLGIKNPKRKKPLKNKKTRKNLDRGE